MNVQHYIFAALATMLTGTVYQSCAADSPIFTSKYGQIQNVQNYSSNPFWSPSGGYRQGMPVPVYVTGPDLSASDCTRTISTLITNYCIQNNNCTDQGLSDVRPVIILQLSRLPGHNYATSCIGYVDSEYNNYIQKTRTNITEHQIQFPTATMPNPNANGDRFKIQIPTPSAPSWQTEIRSRHQELKQFQAENGPAYETLYYTDFPFTYDDLPFSERMDNAAAGYQAYDGKAPYPTLNIGDFPADSGTPDTPSPTPPSDNTPNPQENKKSEK